MIDTEKHDMFSFLEFAVNNWDKPFFMHDTQTKRFVYCGNENIAKMLNVESISLEYEMKGNLYMINDNYCLDINWNGYQHRWNSVIHRLDGPAFCTFTFDKKVGKKQWVVNGYQITDKITEWAIERNIDLNNLTDDEKLIIKLEWSNYGRQKHI